MTGKMTYEAPKTEVTKIAMEQTVICWSGAKGLGNAYRNAYLYEQDLGEYLPWD